MGALVSSAAPQAREGSSARAPEAKAWGQGNGMKGLGIAGP